MINTVAPITAWQVFLAGGPVMGPILLCSVGAMALVMERFLFLSKVDEDMPVFAREVVACVRRNDIKGAVAACDGRGAPLAGIFRSGLLRFGDPAADITAAMEDAACRQVQVISKGLDLLALIARIAPLLGLLGTVIGLCGVLHMVQVRAAAVNPAGFTDIAAGLWSSLITTAAGLSVGIPVMAACQYFMKKLDCTVGHMERLATDLVRAMTDVIDVPAAGPGE